MDSKELAYAKQGGISATDWDTFQKVIRKCLRPIGLNGRQSIAWIKTMLVISVLMASQIMVGQAEAMTRSIKSEPAIVIAAFGTTTKAQATYEFFQEQLQKELPAEFGNYQIVWAFTSEIVRELANQKFKKTGVDQRYLGLSQVLANLEDEGYRKIIIQSLHIFPGQEYEDMEKVIESFRHLGLRIEYGGTLLHEWPWVFEAIDILAKEFLNPNEGSNVLVVHGTPETFPGSNSTYLGLDRYLSRKYSNVFVGGVDGILTREQALDQAKAYPVKRVRLIPFMFVAGDHIMNDIMGEKADDDGVPSWAMELNKAGLEVDTVRQTYQGHDFYKGLGFYEKINRMFVRQLIENLKRLEKE